MITGLETRTEKGQRSKGFFSQKRRTSGGLPGEVVQNVHCTRVPVEGARVG